MSSGTKMVKRPNWPIILFFGVTTAGALLGVPLYLQHYRLSLGVILLTLFYVSATGLAITVGYHRLFAHSTFKANRFVEFLGLFFGAAAFEQSALTWSSGHRDHHRYVDTEQDPYSIKKGFWYAHIGWMTLWQQHPDYSNAKDLLKNRMLMNQHRHYPLWGFGAGVVLPVVVGAFMGDALGALVFAVCARLTFVYHATFCINSVCHTFGKATYDIHATARDNWFTALLTNGEGYHNFHHRFPTDYRNGVRWYHYDPSKWMIAFLERMGWAWDVQKVSQFAILAARLAAENQLVTDRLIKHAKDHPRLEHVRETLQAHYAHLMQKLSDWRSSVEKRENVMQARLEFIRARGKWNEFISRQPRQALAA